MPNFKNKKFRFCFFALLISCAIMLLVFFATDGLLGDKEFSQYTEADWKLAILPLSIIVVSAVSTLVFTVIILVPYIRIYPALCDYLKNKKFSEIDPETTLLVFDNNELKRACCRPDEEKGVYISVKEYDLKTKKWIVIEECRHIESADYLFYILQNEYKFDNIKPFYKPN